jgi:hypothetical protein
VGKEIHLTKAGMLRRQERYRGFAELWSSTEILGYGNFRFKGNAQSLIIIKETRELGQ